MPWLLHLPSAETETQRANGFAKEGPAADQSQAQNPVPSDPTAFPAVPTSSCDHRPGP